MNPIYQTLLRSVVKLLAGALVAKGLADESTAETVTAGIIAVAGVVWGVLHRKAPAASQSGESQAVPIKTIVPAVAAILALSAGGCARFSSYQEQTRLDGTMVKQRQSVTTFFDGKSEIAKLRASTTDKTQGLTVGGLSEETSGTNAVNLVENITRAAVSAAIGAAK